MAYTINLGAELVGVGVTPNAFRPGMVVTGRVAADPVQRSTKPLETALDAMLVLIAREAAA